MGNKLGRKRQVVDERYTRPQGLYVHKDVDHKKLRKLILESKLAPCYPGDEDCCHDYEECPICFLYYPSLNRSRCCMKGICTECFLQMKNPNSPRPTQCPFCKTSNYAVEYRGVKTKEEKGLEQIEEQRVIEAKIRARHQELMDDEVRMQKRLESSSSACVVLGDVEHDSTTVLSSSSPSESEEVGSAQYSMGPPPNARSNRDDEFDLDLEDIMVMEAIWLSIQENGRQRNPSLGNAASSEQNAADNCYASLSVAPMAGSSSSPSGGLACAIAALAERQQSGGDFSLHTNGNASGYNMLPRGSSFYNRLDNAENYSHAQCSSVAPYCRITGQRDVEEWTGDRESNAAEAGTSYASSDSMENDDAISSLPPPPPPPLPPQLIEGNFSNVSGPIVSGSFEEQMMLAMAVSLAEARAVTKGPGGTWQ